MPRSTPSTNFGSLGTGANPGTRGPVPSKFRPGPFSPGRHSTGLNQFADQVNRANAAISGRGNRGSAIDQLGSALQRDIDLAQGAADRQFDRGQEQIGRAEDLIGGVDERLSGVANKTAGQLGELGGEFDVLGRDTLTDFDEFAEGVQGSVGADVDSLSGEIDANSARTREGADLLSKDIGERADATTERVGEFAEGAVQSAEDAIFDTQDLANKQMTSAITGLEARTRKESQRIDAGLNPDGTQMTPAERRAAKASLRADTNVQLTQVATQLASQSKLLLAQLTTNLADTKLQAGQLTLGAGAQQLQAGQLKAGLEQLKADTDTKGTAQKAGLVGLKAEVGVQLGGQRVQAAGIAQQFQSMRADLAKFGATVVNSAKSTAIGLEMQGRFGVAQLTRENPETIVGMFSGLAAMLAARSAPGAGNIPAFNFGGPDQGAT